MIKLHKVLPRASKKNCNQSGPSSHVSHIEYNAYFELRGYSKKHGRDLKMRDLNEIGASIDQRPDGQTGHGQTMCSWIMVVGFHRFCPS